MRKYEPPLGIHQALALSPVAEEIARRCADEMVEVIEKDGRTHALIRKASPWRNGIIERSHRTDNDEGFHRIRFTSSEDRRYQHRLWEIQYNFQRPHQGLDNKTPFQVYKVHYQFHAGSRNL